MDTVSLILSSISIVFTFVNLIIFIWKFYNVHYCSNRRRRKMSKLMANKVNMLNPDIIIAPSINGMEVAKEIINYTTHNYPLYAIAIHYRHLVQNPSSFSCCSHRYAIDIPYPNLSFYKSNKKILIIDDLYVTGDTIECIISDMEKNGYKKENIFTLGLVVDTLSAKTNRFPDYYAKSYDISKFTFAWRK